MSGTSVGDLFVNLGIKGADKTIGAISSTTKGMGELGSASLQAKAAIIAALYAIERLFSESGKFGTELTNFGLVTGQSAEELQRWQYGMKLAGGTADEMTGTINKLRQAMASISIGEGIPNGLLILSQAAGGIDFSKKDDPFYMLKAFQKALKNLQNDPLSKTLAEKFLSNVGITPNFIAGTLKGKFDEKVLNSAPIISKKSLETLDRERELATKTWAELQKQVIQAFADNPHLISDTIIALKDFSIQIIALTKIISQLVENSGLLPTVKSGFNFLEKQEQPGGYFTKKGFVDYFNLLGTPTGFVDILKKDYAAPKTPNREPQSSKETNINVNQNLNFQHEGKDHKQTSDSVKKAVQDSYRQMSAQAQGG